MFIKPSASIRQNNNKISVICHKTKVKVNELYVDFIVLLLLPGGV
jgi:hypothetical protein